MQFGIWTPLPHTIRPEPGMERAVAEIKSARPTLGGREDGTFAFACEVVGRADELGFDTTLIAERFLGPDLSSWVLASALAMVTKRIELMVAVHPGMVTPQVVAKMTASLDRISRGRAALNIVNGWWKEEFDLFSNGGWIGDAQRYPRMGEYIAVIKGLWTDSNFTFDGAYYRARVRPALTGAEGKEIIAQRLLRYEKIGLDCAMLRFTPMLEGVETFGRTVMPLVRAGGVFAGCGARCEIRDRHR